jgi:tRNA threonylcarbamoyladenosine biosynthesis protein TsaB
MNWILGIDTSSTDLSVGLFRCNEPVASFSRHLRNSHAEHISQAVSFLLHSCGAGPAEITHVALAAGPGSFTGLRIGFAFVKGFCLADTVKVLPVSSLFVLAHCALGRTDSAVAAIDARRGEVFWARFSIHGTHIKRETENSAGPADMFRESLSPDDTIVIDTLGYSQSTAFDFLSGRPGVLSALHCPVQRGLCCAAAGAAASGCSAAWKTAGEALPEYLRSFTSTAISRGAAAR